MTEPKITHAMTSPMVWAEAYTPYDHWQDPQERVRVEADLVAALTREVGQERAERGTLHTFDVGSGVRMKLVAAPWGDR